MSRDRTCVDPCSVTRWTRTEGDEAPANSKLVLSGITVPLTLGHHPGVVRLPIRKAFVTCRYAKEILEGIPSSLVKEEYPLTTPKRSSEATFFQLFLRAPRKGYRRGHPPCSTCQTSRHQSPSSRWSTTLDTLGPLQARQCPAAFSRQATNHREL